MHKVSYQIFCLFLFKKKINIGTSHITLISINVRSHFSHSVFPPPAHTEYCTFIAPAQKLIACSYQQAQYLYLEYRFIPTNSTNTLTLSTSGDFSVDAFPHGVVTSPGYPEWEELANYQRSLVTLNPYKAIRLYVTDMDIEDPVLDSSEMYKC